MDGNGRRPQTLGDAVRALLHGQAEANGAPPRADPLAAWEPESWPEPPADAALHGLAGEVVARIGPETEADPVALLLQYLAAFGSAAGRTAYYPVGPRKHHGNLYVCLVGRTAKGRKGTGWSWAETIFRGADPDWALGRIESGLSSGEGVIQAVRDEGSRREAIKDRGRVTGYQEVVTDQGSQDKRLLVVEEEFSGALRCAARDGNILSAVLRQAWDTGQLRTLTRSNPLRATGAHVAVVGHITQEELLKQLKETEVANGFANRFLWACVQRSKLLADGGGDLNLTDLIDRTRCALEGARMVGRMHRSPECQRRWREVYPRLSAETPGTLGLVTNRAEAQVLRLSLLYALLDLSDTIHEWHLEAALAVWDYCQRSCRWVFGDSTGSDDADELLAALRHATAERGGMTMTEVSAYFSRHKTAAEIKRVLSRLHQQGLARFTTVATGGRPALKWTAIDGAKKANAAKDEAPQ